MEKKIPKIFFERKKRWLIYYISVWSLCMSVCYSVYVCKTQFVCWFVFISKLCGSVYGCVVLDSRMVKKRWRKKKEYGILLWTCQSAVTTQGQDSLHLLLKCRLLDGC